MLRLILALCCVLAGAVPPYAACVGANLLERMPPDARAALDARIADDPFAEGNHWRAVRGTSTIDIIGTMHIRDDRMVPIVDRLAPMLAGADGLLLEATEAEMRQLQSEMARNPALIFAPGPTLPERLDEPEWQSLSAALRKRGFPPFLASKMRPWFAAMLLSIPACALDRSGQPTEGLDDLLQAEARKAGVPVMALEPWDTILRVFAAMEQTDQIQALRTALLVAEQSDDFFATMVAAYFDQRHRLIWELSRDLNRLAPDPAAAERDFALMEKVLLTDRNRSWIDPIEAAAEGRHIVVGVGAAHLSGPDGVIRLLHERGWTVERAEF